MKRLAVILLLMLAAALPAAAQTEVSFNTEDGWKIYGSYRASSNGSFVIFLHDLGKKKESFDSLCAKTNDYGFGCLSIDLRGHGKSVNKGLQKEFSKTGVDNEFNQMTRDVSAAITYLNQKGVDTEKIFLAGAGLGANVAARSVVFNPSIAGLALFTPSLKSRDVITISGIRVFKNPVFIAASALESKSFMEASFIRNAAFLSLGEGMVTFVTAYNLSGVEMVNKYLMYSFLQWLQTPRLPQVLPDGPDAFITLPPPSALTESAAG